MINRILGAVVAALMLFAALPAFSLGEEEAHTWNIWTPDADGAHHTASCATCNAEKTVACTRFTVTVADEGLRVCPFCGRSGDAQFAIVEDATAAPVSATPAAQRGDLLVRGMAQPFAGDPSILYAFTMVYGQDGALVTFKNVSEINVPLGDLALPDSVRVVRVSGAAGDDSTQTPEQWNDLDFTVEQGVLTFQNRTPSLYLILAA